MCATHAIKKHQLCNNDVPDFNRRTVLQLGLFGGSTALAAPSGTGEAHGRSRDLTSKVKPFELDEITIADLQRGLKVGKYSAHSIAQKYLDRIHKIDQQGPSINAVLEINPNALAIAKALDREYKERGPRGPLHGIPILIKDNIDTADAMMTTAGSLALVGAPKPPKDSFVVRNLRRVGAIILAKTNLSEWANIRSVHSTSGWSGRGGLTRNPYALDRNPCGSSSGAAAGISANLGVGGIGTGTDGSIVCPASANGLVGVKPTLGLVSRSGIIPISESQDTAGPLCRTVYDAAVLLGALTGVDPEDPYSRAAEGKSFGDYTRFLDPNGLKGARIGVVRKFFGFSDVVDRLMTQAIDLMKKQGALIIDPADIETLDKFGETEFLVFLYELKDGIRKYLTRLGPACPVKSLKDIIDFNERNAQREMPYFGQDTFLKAEEKGPLSSKEYLEALKKNHELAGKQGIDAVMGKFQLDALVAPTGGPAWLADLINGDHGGGGSSNVAAVAGYPNITVRAGFVFGLPVGISFFGRAWSEPKLLKLAYAFEQASHLRKAPKFLPSADLGA
jgi:amidase